MVAEGGSPLSQGLTCLILETTDSLQLSLISLLEQCPKLTTFGNLKGHINQDIVESLSNSVRDLRIDYPQALDCVVETIAQKGWHLERLMIHGHDELDAVVDEKHLKLIREELGQNIKTINVWSHPHNMVYMNKTGQTARDQLVARIR
jgi:hemoglobin-like flavoprotein